VYIIIICWVDPHFVETESRAFTCLSLHCITPGYEEKNKRWTTGIDLRGTTKTDSLSAAWRQIRRTGTLSPRYRVGELERWKYKTGEREGKRESLEGLRLYAANERSDRGQKNRRRTCGQMRVQVDYLREQSSKNGSRPAVEMFTLLKDPTADGPPFLEVVGDAFSPHILTPSG
jgi:hypothetical protein